MGKFTPEELARMAPGRSPEQLANLDMDDGEWERKGAELRAAEAERAHQLDMIKMEGLHALNSVQHDPEILADARAIHAQNPAGPSADELIETVIIPIREKYLKQFSSGSAAPAPTKVGKHEAEFLRLMGGNNG